MKPHKHAALIKAWADGAEIQFRMHDWGEWATLSKASATECAPAFRPSWEYRIKPKTIKVRLALFGKLTNNTYVIAVNESSDVATKGSDNFIKWLGDWQVVEV